jgi:hypothetical protein
MEQNKHHENSDSTSALIRDCRRLGLPIDYEEREEIMWQIILNETDPVKRAVLCHIYSGMICS